MVSFVNFSRSHDYENFPCCFHDKHGCYAMCYVIGLKLELYRLQKTVVLVKLQKVNKSSKQRMQHSKCFTVIFGAIFPISLTICILGRSVY